MKKIFLLLSISISSLAQNISTSGKIGVGLDSPVSKLQVNQVGNYSLNENSPHGFLLKDPNATTPHFLYMGSDATNGLSYIQSVAQGAFKPLLLQGRGGNVGIGVLNPTQRLEVSGNTKISGDLVVQNDKGIVRSVNSNQMTLQQSAFLLENKYINPNSVQDLGLITFLNSYPTYITPVVSIGNYNCIEGDCAKVIITVSEVTNTYFQIKGYNPSNNSISFSGFWFSSAISMVIP